jgi:hypothetical protein
MGQERLFSPSRSLDRCTFNCGRSGASADTEDPPTTAYEDMQGKMRELIESIRR